MNALVIQSSLALSLINNEPTVARMENKPSIEFDLDQHFIEHDGYTILGGSSNSSSGSDSHYSGIIALKRRKYYSVKV